MTVNMKEVVFWDIPLKETFFILRFEVFTAVTMTNGVFWDVTPCGSCHPDEGGASSSETSDLTTATLRNIPEDAILNFSLYLYLHNNYSITLSKQFMSLLWQLEFVY
jgi:hypothetical protein